MRGCGGGRWGGGGSSVELALPPVAIVVIREGVALLEGILVLILQLGCLTLPLFQLFAVETLALALAKVGQLLLKFLELAIRERLGSGTGAHLSTDIGSNIGSDLISVLRDLALSLLHGLAIRVALIAQLLSTLAHASLQLSGDLLGHLECNVVGELLSQITSCIGSIGIATFVSHIVSHDVTLVLSHFGCNLGCNLTYRVDSTFKTNRLSNLTGNLVSDLGSVGLNHEFGFLLSQNVHTILLVFGDGVGSNIFGHFVRYLGDGGDGTAGSIALALTLLKLEFDLIGSLGSDLTDNFVGDASGQVREDLTRDLHSDVGNVHLRVVLGNHVGHLTSLFVGDLLGDLTTGGLRVGDRFLLGVLQRDRIGAIGGDIGSDLRKHLFGNVLGHLQGDGTHGVLSGLLGLVFGAHLGHLGGGVFGDAHRGLIRDSASVQHLLGDLLGNVIGHLTHQVLGFGANLVCQLALDAQLSDDLLSALVGDLVGHLLRVLAGSVVRHTGVQIGGHLVGHLQRNLASHIHGHLLGETRGLLDQLLINHGRLLVDSLLGVGGAHTTGQSGRSLHATRKCVLQGGHAGTQATHLGQLVLKHGHIVTERIERILQIVVGHSPTGTSRSTRLKKTTLQITNCSSKHIQTFLIFIDLRKKLLNRTRLFIDGGTQRVESDAHIFNTAIRTVHLVKADLGLVQIGLHIRHPSRGAKKQNGSDHQKSDRDALWQVLHFHVVHDTTKKSKALVV
mmetsp:Transcript_5528/g.16910  ORF Transcript_5528/g.16910 Transcript_5528/m.16910 type:complete len:732 (-) Transcript_5528:94-2289(-)